MAGKRVRDFAQDWGVDVKQVIDAARRVGIGEKKAASSLNEAEAAQIAQELGIGQADRTASIVGDERVVTDSAGQTRVERRVRPNVIVRRSAAQASSPASTASARPALTSPPTSSDIAAPVASPLSGPEPLPDALEPLPGLETGVLVETPIEAPTLAPEPASPVLPEQPARPSRAEAEPEATSKAPAQPAAPQADSAGVRLAGEAGPRLEARAGEVVAPSNEAAAPRAGAERGIASEEPPRRGPKVLGKINLRDLPGAPGNRERGARDRVTARDGGAPAFPPLAPPPPVGERPRKKSKKQVFEKADLGEGPESERRRFKTPKKKKPAPGTEIRKTEITVPRAARRVLRIHGAVTVQDLARLMSIRVQELVAKLLELGAPAKAPDTLDFDTAAIAASEFGFTLENVVFDAEQELEKEAASQPDRPEDLLPRPPVVTVMGHVDHGKTSLLDAIRKTNVTAQEAGGITQHIGAYSVDVGGQKITFLDTPGHEAFTAMRARGAKVTDLVVLVVAADDGVMPQTEEAINHARAADVPIIVAITKIDKPEANVERVKTELGRLGLTPEEWGGDTSVVPVSAKSGQGIQELLEMILLRAELLELKANANKAARGTIVEAKLERGRGPVATVLVKEGTLRVGDTFVCGPYYGRVRAMINDRGERVKEAGPSTPVEILGLDGVPEAGVSFVVVQDEARARQIAESLREKQREESLASKGGKVTLEDIHRRALAGEVRELAVVLKADVHGSVEALCEALSRLSTPEVGLKILHASVGGITETDVMLASASQAVVIGFNVRPESKASEAAEREGVQIRLYNVIYDVINDVRDAMEGLLEPEKVEKRLGQAEVREVFRIPSAGTVAGCMVTEGKILRNAQARLIRDHVVVYTGRIASLRRFKEDVREVAAGYECGIGLENFQDIKVGDLIEVFEIQEVAARLGTSPRPAAAVERRA